MSESLVNLRTLITPKNENKIRVQALQSMDHIRTKMRPHLNLIKKEMLRVSIKSIRDTRIKDLGKY